MKIQVSEAKGLINIAIPSTVKRERQRRLIQDLVKSNNLGKLIEYLESLAGKRRHIYLDRPDRYGDDLATKEKGTNKILFDRMLLNHISHVPTSPVTDYVGVEIECFIPFESLGVEEKTECEDCDGTGRIETRNDDDELVSTSDCRRCDGEGFRYARNTQGRATEALAKIFKDNKIKFSTIKHDGSIQAENGCWPVEITVLTRVSYPENLKRVCRILKELDAKVNKSCGLHVHLDARHLDGNQVVAIGKQFTKAMPVLQAMIPNTRRSNTYCRPRVSGLRGDRYCAVNLTAFKKFRTIEVRMHSSTTDFNKIMQWARLVDAIAKSKIKKECRTINELTDFVRLDENLLEYVGQRTELFSGTRRTTTEFQDTEDTDSTQTEIGA